MAGLGLGAIDVNGIVDNLMTAQSRKVNSLHSSRKLENTKLAVLDNVNKLVNDFQDSLSSLTKAFEVVGYQANSSNSSGLTASISDNTVVPGTHTFAITQLATSQVVASDAFTSQTPTFATQTLTFTSSADASKHFSVNVSNGKSLQDIQGLINNNVNNFGIKASVLKTTGMDNVTPEYVLVINAADSGTAKQFSISGDVANDFHFATQEAGQNAIFSFDGYNEVRSSNSVTDVMDGLTLDLLAEGQSGSVTITPASGNQQSAVVSGVQDLVTKYNALIQYVDSQNTFFNNYLLNSLDSKDEGAVHLSVDTNLQALTFVKTIMQKVMYEEHGTSEAIDTLWTCGIEHAPYQEMSVSNINGSERDEQFISTGSLSVNKQALTNLVATNLSAVKEFFTNASDGLITSLDDAIHDKILAYGTTGVLGNANHQVTDLVQSLSSDIATEDQRLATVREGLMTKYSQLNAKLSLMDAVSKALDKQIMYLDTLVKPSR